MWVGPPASQAERGVNPVQPRLLFLDEARQDPSLERFRAALMNTVKKRDARRLLEASSHEIQKRFNSGLDPKGTFKPLVYDIEWQELETILSLGGSFTTRRGSVQGRREFCAPYVYSAYPEPINTIVERMAGHNENPEGDPWVVLGSKVPIHEKASSNSKVLMYLSHDLVIPTGTESPGSPPPQWFGVYVPGGGIGWIRVEQLRNRDDYHACFAEIGGEWKLVLFEHS